MSQTAVESTTQPAGGMPVNAFTDKARAIESAVGTVIVGQHDLVRQTLICLLANGHALLEGVPGLGKTMLVRTIADAIDCAFSRIQFTPDLMPADITGTNILVEQAGTRQFRFQHGPIFANLVLADEINRATPKTQSALLEAMAEQQVTVAGTSHPLAAPFFVLATLNPIEMEGTYQLPEAQLDRFLFRVQVPPVGAKTLATLLTQRVRGDPPELKPVLSREGLASLFDLVDRVHLPAPIADYIGRLVEATDPSRPSAPEVVRRFVRYGASPRAALGIAHGARAAALAKAKPNVGFDEVAEVAPAVLNHRLVLSYEASLEKVGPGRLIEELLRAVPEVPRA
jgi:MoxR-like ATPase